MTRTRYIALLVCGLQLIFVAVTHADTTPILSNQDRFKPEVAKQGMVATQQAIATRVGLDILKSGGNAVDAAVAVGFALAVTLPRAGNLGGGGFMLIRKASDNQVVAVDYREKAPKLASRDMYLDEAGEVVKNRSRFTPLAVGVPGTVAGLALAQQRYGSMPLAVVMQAAIDLASQGFEVDRDLADSLSGAKKRLQQWPASKANYYKADGSSYAVGDWFKQADLAASLKLIARDGPQAFYQGVLAQSISDYMVESGGLITREDLADYQAKIRQPVQGNYRGYDIYSMPPPSSGGAHIVQMLNLLEPYPLSEFGQNSAESIHLMSEVMRLAYADRSKYLGDSDFVEVPINGLISKDYSKQLANKINRDQVTPSASIKAGDPSAYESNETTHFSIVDQWGNSVSNTYTLNFSYGSGITVPGTGILLNNEMDDFSAKPGVPNAYGLIGGTANAIEPEKRMLSSMSPTIVTRDGQLFLVTGSPGGSRIITTTLQIILNVIDHQMNIAEATNAVRVHHQWLPDELRIEEGLSRDTIRLLEARGHKVKMKRTMGSTQSIMRVDGMLHGASDPRTPSALSLGY